MNEKIIAVLVLVVILIAGYYYYSTNSVKSCPLTTASNFPGLTSAGYCGSSGTSVTPTGGQDLGGIGSGHAPADCAKACAAKAGCNVFQWNKANGNCWGYHFPTAAAANTAMIHSGNADFMAGAPMVSGLSPWA